MINYRLLITCLAFLFSFLSYAGKFDNQSRKGMMISPDSLPEALRSGDTALFSGNICFLKVKEIEKGKGKKPKCENIKEADLKITAFFPDATTEVTDAVSFQKVSGNNGKGKGKGNNKKGFDYSFTTPDLEVSDSNVFTLIIGAAKERDNRFLKTQAKLQKRLFELNKKIVHYQNEGVTQEELANLLAFKTLLENVQNQVDEVIANNPEILGRIDIPLQVDNKIAAPYSYLSSFGGFKLSYRVDNGSPIEGEKAKIEAKVINLSHRFFNFPEFEDVLEEDSEEPKSLNLSLKLSHDDNELFRTPFQSLALGESVEVSSETGKLSPSNANEILLEMIQLTDEGDEKLDGRIENSFQVHQDNVAPIWEEGSLPEDSVKFVQNFPTIKASVKDNFGRLDPEAFNVTVSGALLDGSSVTIDRTSKFQFTTPNQGQNYDLSGDINPLDEGVYQVELRAFDFAGNAAEVDPFRKTNIRVDRTPPLAAIETEDNQLTNNPNFVFKVGIFDHSPTTTKILQNGFLIFEGSEDDIEIPILLEEGLNTFEVQSIDAAGNIAVVQKLNSIELDTIPPELSNFSPNEGDLVFTLDFLAKGVSNEPLSMAKVNGELAPLAQDKLTFQRDIVAPLEGSFVVEYEAYDLAGNSSSQTVNIEIVLKVLNQDLVTIEPSSEDSSRLIVRGAQRAARPGVEVSLIAGVFNQIEVTANIDGSFEGELNFFEEIFISATDEDLGRTDSFTLMYSADTTLSGKVLDYKGTPLAGVKVVIEGTDQYAMTDATGSFSILEPATGDRIICFDGTTVPENVSGENKKYSKTNVAVSIGTTQLNVIEDPIFLTPLMLDGSETNIPDENTAVTITSSHAPGVSLDIPAGTVTFPDGGVRGNINVMEIQSSVTSVPVPEFAVPDTVYAFEPSGLKFSEPVRLTLPNVNEFPEGMQLVILSKNSEKGIWEIDGLARVDSGGASITTEENSGITHFSEIFAAPLGLRHQEFGGIEKPGADTFNGSLSSSISLPSYKVLGEDVSLGMVYNSATASPGIVVSNVFDIPRNQAYYEQTQGGRNFVYEGSVQVEINSWVEPEWIKAQFRSNDIISDKMTFRGVPNKSVVSYAMDLAGQNSGVRPYLSSYEVKLKQMVLTTKTFHEKKLFKGARSWQEHSRETRELEEVYPSEVAGSIIVDNLSNSSYGSGWRPAGIGKLLNTSGPRLVVQGNSNITYGLDNVIETVYQGIGGELRAADFTDENTLRVVDANNDVREHDYLSGNAVTLGSIPSFGGLYTWNYVHGTPWGAYFCGYRGKYWSRNQLVENMITLPTGDIIFTDRGGIISKFNNGGGVEHIGGLIYGTPSNQGFFGGFCSTEGVSCGGTIDQGGFPANSCYLPPRPPSGSYQAAGYVDGTLGINSVAFNSPKGLTPGISANTFILADYGNHRLRKIDLNNNQVTTIAGNGQTNDNGNLVNALQASIYRPQGVIYDSSGNLYVSSERGLIRKIDPSGVISHFAGKDISDGGVLTDSAQATDMYLSAPYGMAIDKDGDHLYVADMGNNRVIKINFANGIAETVAGNGSCGAPNDGGSALNASICAPKTIALDKNGNLLILDSGHNSIRRVLLNSGDGTKLTYTTRQVLGSKLEKFVDGSFTLTDRSGVKSHFDSKGFQTSLEDRTGRVSRYVYDSEGRILKVVDPMGGETIYAYSGGKLTSITDPASRTTSFSYSGNNLSQVQFPDGSSRSFEYDSYGLMTAEYDQRGQKTQYVYNEWKRLENVIRPDLTKVTIQDKGSATVGNNFDSANPQELKSSAEGEVVDGILDPKGNTTEFKSDSSGYISTIIDAQDRETNVERNLDGLPTKITRPDDTEVTLTYDPNTNDLLSKFDTGTGAMIEQTFDSFGNILTRKDPAGNVAETNVYEVDTGLLKTQTNQLGQISRFTYYDLGLVQDRIDPLGNMTSFEYDAYGNLSKTIDQLEKETLFERDTAGNITKITNPNGQVTRREYDAFNRLTAVVSPKNERTEYSYLPTGELSQIKDPRGGLTLFEYDFLGRLTKKTDPQGRVTRLAYDANGNVIQEITPSGVTKTFEYDSLDQLTKRILPDDIIELDYDIRGNVTMARNNKTQLDFTYTRRESGELVETVTSRGLGSKSNLPVTTLNFDYDTNGNRTFVGTPVGDFDYTYDIGNRLSSLTNHKSEVFNFSFDQNNRLSEITRPGSKTVLSFDDSSFVTRILHSKTSNSSQITFFDYQRDHLGNRTQIRTPAGDFDYTYDNNNQVVVGTNPEATTNTYTYDSLGNRITDETGNYNYSLDRQQLVEDPRFTYVYDDNGNLSSKISKTSSEVTNFIHNSENQLIDIEFYEGTTLKKSVEYIYDALGRRVEKEITDHVNSSNSYARRFVYDSDEILLEYDQDNKLLATYTHSSLRTDDVLSIDVTADGQSSGIATQVGSLFYLKDAQGSVMEVVDSQGASKQRHIYNTFGRLLQIKDSGGNDIISAPVLKPFFSYTNREYDEESGLYYYRARYYDASVGRFLQVDPIPGVKRAPILVNNKYVYAANNPILYTDPNGELPFLAVLAIGAVISGTISGALSAGQGGNFFKGFLGGAAAATIVGVTGGLGGLAGGALFGTATASTVGGVIGGGVGGALGTFAQASITGGEVSAASLALGIFAGAVTGGIIGARIGASGSFVNDANRAAQTSLEFSTDIPNRVAPNDGFLPIENLSPGLDFGPGFGGFVNDVDRIINFCLQGGSCSGNIPTLQ